MLGHFLSRPLTRSDRVLVGGIFCIFLILLIGWIEDDSRDGVQARQEAHNVGRFSQALSTFAWLMPAAGQDPGTVSPSSSPGEEKTTTSQLSVRSSKDPAKQTSEASADALSGHGNQDSVLDMNVMKGKIGHAPSMALAKENAEENAPKLQDSLPKANTESTSHLPKTKLDTGGIVISSPKSHFNAQNSSGDAQVRAPMAASKVIKIPESSADSVRSSQAPQSMGQQGGNLEIVMTVMTSSVTAEDRLKVLHPIFMEKTNNLHGWYVSVLYMIDSGKTIQGIDDSLFVQTPW
jgi:hypothetical protein